MEHVIHENSRTPEKLLTVAQVADILATSKSVIYALLHQGELPFVSIGQSKGYRVTPEDLDEFIHQRRTVVEREVRKFRPSHPRLKHIKI